MTYFSVPADRRAQSGGVYLLDCKAPVAFDPLPVKCIYARLSAQEAEDLICRFLEDIALRLDLIQRGLAASDPVKMLRPARRVQLAAGQIGLREVAESAGHLRTCLAQHDGIALQAVMARLERAFDIAVNEVWNLREM